VEDVISKRSTINSVKSIYNAIQTQQVEDVVVLMIEGKLLSEQKPRIRSKWPRLSGIKRNSFRLKGIEFVNMRA